MAPQFQQSSRIPKGQGPGRSQGGILAKGVPGHKCSALDRHAEFPLEGPRDGQANGHQCGLRVFGKGQLVLWTVLHKGEELLAEGLIDLLKDLPRSAKGFGEVNTHADGLAALTRKQECAH